MSNVVQGGTIKGSLQTGIEGTIDAIVKKVLAKTSRVTTVTLTADRWEGTTSPYYQGVTFTGATENSKIDLNPTVEQLNVFHNKDISFVVENDNGVTTVYCVGQKPTSDYTIQATIVEVAIDG